MSVFAAFFLLLSVSLGAEPVNYTIAWKLETPIQPVGVTLYPDTVHPTGFITASGNELIRGNAQGGVVWRTSFEKPVAALPAVASLDGEGDPEIVCVLNSGTVACVNADGTIRWTRAFHTPADSFDFAVAGEVHLSPGLEVLVGFSEGWLYCLSAKGETLWRFFGDKFRVGPAIIADVDANGANEVVYGTDNGNVYCIKGWGEVLWRFTDGGPYGRSAPNAADLDGDGMPEVLLTRSNNGIACGLAALDGKTGALKWRSPSEQQSYCSNAVADLDGDGKQEVLFADKGNWVYCVNADGKERWRTELWGRGIFFAPAVGDTDGDGRPEILVGVRDTDPAVGACAFRLDAAGQVLDRLAIGSSANAAPALADLDQDGVLEALFCTSGPNAVQAIRWNGGGKVQWACMRGESDNNAAPPGLRADNVWSEAQDKGRTVTTAKGYWGENETPIQWQESVSGNAFVELMPLLHYVPNSEIRIFPLPEGAQNTVVRWNWDGEINQASISAKVKVSGSLMEHAKEVFVFDIRPPGECGYDSVDWVCRKAIEAGVGVGMDTSILSTLLSLLKAASEMAADNDPKQQARKATQLRRDAKNLFALAQTLSGSWASGGVGSFICWEDANPWDAFDPHFMPEKLDKDLALHIRACGNEQEDAAINLLNVSTAAMNVRCVFAKPELDGKQPTPEPDLAKHVTLRRGVSVPGDSGNMVLDALPALDESRTITLAPGEVSQLWLVVNTEGLPPGEHPLTLYLGSLERPMTLRAIPVVIEVLPIELPKGVYAQMNWVSIDLIATPDAQLKDMLDHGITVAYGPNLPTIPLDTEGHRTGVIDWTRTDAGLARVPQYFQCLFSSVPAAKWPEGMNAPTEGPLFDQGFKTCLDEMAKHLSAMGWGYERWALYPYDEPWLTGFTLVKPLRDYCQRVKSIDPNVRMYADPAGRVLPQFLDEFKGLLDIFQPEINLLKRDPALLKWCQDHAPAFWAYEATGPGKDLLPLGYYRGYAWLAWRFGLQGAGFWCYKYFDSYWPLETTDWSVVYPADNSVSPSRRWEATRDGQEDYRLFYVLREEIKRAREAGQSEAANRAQTLLDQAVEEVVGVQATTIDEITRQTRDYELDYGKLLEYRGKIENEILALRG